MTSNISISIESSAAVIYKPNYIDLWLEIRGLEQSNTMIMERKTTATFQDELCCAAAGLFTAGLTGEKNTALAVNLYYLSALWLCAALSYLANTSETWLRYTWPREARLRDCQYAGWSSHSPAPEFYEPFPNIHQWQTVVGKPINIGSCCGLLMKLSYRREDGPTDWLR